MKLFRFADENLNLQSSEQLLLGYINRRHQLYAQQILQASTPLLSQIWNDCFKSSLSG